MLPTSFLHPRQTPLESQFSELVLSHAKMLVTAVPASTSTEKILTLPILKALKTPLDRPPI